MQTEPMIYNVLVPRDLQLQVFGTNTPPLESHPKDDIVALEVVCENEQSNIYTLVSVTKESCEALSMSGIEGTEFLDGDELERVMLYLDEDDEQIS